MIKSQRRIATQPASILLHKFALVTALVLLALAAWGGQTAVVILLGLGLAAAGLSQLWSHFSLQGLHCERQLSERRLFPDEYLELKLKLVNRKLLPIPWVQISDEVPAGFMGNSRTAESNRPGFVRITKNTSILWYSAASWKYRLHCTKRGYYPLGPLAITSGDIFGFYPRTMTVAGSDQVIVYPRIFSLAQPVLPSLFLLGEVNSQKRIFEDPSRTSGIRDYRPGDSLRRIHWKASVRQGRLQVKIFEPSTTLRVDIFLSIDSFQQEGQWNLEELEKGISSSASLAKHLLEKKSQVGIFANSKLADSGQPAHIHAATGVDQLLLILEALAKVEPLTSQPFVNFFQEERGNLSLGTTLVFFFSQVPVTMNNILLDLKERGYKVIVFQTAESGAGNRVPEIPVYQITYSDQENGIEIQALE
jgi:uncharacterized protein (DUF58 family)